MKWLVISLLGSCTLASIIPPPSNATYGTDVQTIELVDWSRTDPYNADAGSRKLMLSAIYPTMPVEYCSNATYAYPPPRTAQAMNELGNLYGFPNGSSPVSNLSLSVCPRQRNRHGQHGNWGWHRDEVNASFPVVLFSHGSGGTRFLNTAQAQSVAAQGYIVLTIDHPYNAYFVEYLDGSIINGIPFDTNEALDNDVRIRSQDASFVVNQIRDSSSDLRHALPQLDGDEKVGMFGHSLGGTASARAAFDDSRILGAVNLDGYPYGWNTTGSFSVPEFTLPQNMTTPFLLFDTDDSKDLYGYVQMFDAFSGWKKQLSLADAQHLTFCDVPLLTDLAGIRSTELNAIIGSLDGIRARDAVAAYVSAFMDMVLKGLEAPLSLQGPSSAWPEVGFARG